MPEMTSTHSVTRTMSYFAYNCQCRSCDAGNSRHICLRERAGRISSKHVVVEVTAARHDRSVEIYGS